MRIRVLFFSQLKDLTGTGELALELPAKTNMTGLLTQLYSRYPSLEKWDNQLLLGAGVEFVDRNYILQPNDEIAIMPPVQGG